MTYTFCISIVTAKEREQADWLEACKGIIRPQKPDLGLSFDEWITEHSPVWQRRAVVQIRRYLAKECEYGMNFDVSDSSWDGLQFYPFFDDYHDDATSTLRQHIIGGAGFLPEDDGYNLEFCWVHPFWRNQGRLRRAWTLFEERFGVFSVEPPISNAMEGALKSIKRQQIQEAEQAGASNGG
jgi:hypothetical protein